jgi:hypothetical protein
LQKIEIRIKYIQGSNIKDSEERIKKEWSCMQLFLPNGNSDGNGISTKGSRLNNDNGVQIWRKMVQNLTDIPAAYMISRKGSAAILIVIQYYQCIMTKIFARLVRQID